jgi:hypothetical protein
MIKRHQQRYIAGDDLRQHAHGGADLRSSALVGQQAGQNFFSDGFF